MNEILDNAKLREYELRIRWQSEKYTKRTGQLSLFSEDAFQSTTSLSRPQIDEIAGEIYSQFEHRTALYRDVLRSLVNSPYYHKEIRKAMTQLKKAKQVEYPGSLTHDTMVKFN